MIYLTGDTHNDFSKLSNKSLKKQSLKLTEDDYMIVTGDFGICWAHDKTFDWNCKWFAERSFTTLWVQENHENYDMIAEYPLEEWHGGLVRHIVRDSQYFIQSYALQHERTHHMAASDSTDSIINDICCYHGM